MGNPPLTSGETVAAAWRLMDSVAGDGDCASNPVPRDVADWCGGTGKAWRSAPSLSYPAAAAPSGAFLIGKSDYFISRQTTGGV